MNPSEIASPATAAPWVVAASPIALAALAPLLESRRALQPVVELVDGVEALLAAPERHLPRGAAAVLIVGPRRRSPARMLPGPFLCDAQGRRVPVGWLPDVGDGLAVYAHAAARVLARPRAIGPVVILGQWEDRFLRVGLRTARWFEKHDTAGVLAFHWTADRISRLDMLAGLADTAPGLALYFGHGRPRGWAGYHGVRLDHLFEPWPEPVGALLALCCENASRLRTGTSFAEALALRGVFAGALAAVRPTLHEHNRRLGPDLCEALTSQPIATLAELVLALPPADWARTPYRFIGDPAAPLAGAPGAAERAARVFAPAPDDPLPPWEELPA